MVVTEVTTKRSRRFNVVYAVLHRSTMVVTEVTTKPTLLLASSISLDTLNDGRHRSDDETLADRLRTVRVVDRSTMVVTEVTTKPA